MKPWTKAAVEGAACGLVIGVVLLAGGRMWRPGVAEVVRARNFLLVDAAGSPRAGLGVDSDGSPSLGLADAAGEMRALLGVLRDGSPFLSLYDAAGKVIWKAP